MDIEEIAKFGIITAGSIYASLCAVGASDSVIQAIEDIREHYDHWIFLKRFYKEKYSKGMLKIEPTPINLYRIYKSIENEGLKSRCLTEYGRKNWYLNTSQHYDQSQPSPLCFRNNS